MQSPILVTGLPRSGTSLVTGVLTVCDAWLGNTAPPSPYNRKGSQENEVLKDQFNKPLLSLLRCDPLGLKHLPPVDQRPLIDKEYWRQKVLDVIHLQGYVDGPWAFKDAKSVLVWRQWALAFPGATWLIVRRDLNDVLSSCLRAEPMVRQLGASWKVWRLWAERYEAHINELINNVPLKQIVTINTSKDAFSSESNSLREMVESLGLTWRKEAVQAFADKRLWNGKL